MAKRKNMRPLILLSEQMGLLISLGFAMQENEMDYNPSTHFRASDIEAIREITEFIRAAKARGVEQCNRGRTRIARSMAPISQNIKCSFYPPASHSRGAERIPARVSEAPVMKVKRVIRRAVEPGASGRRRGAAFGGFGFHFARN